LSEFVPSYAVPSGWRSTSGSRITVGWARLRKNQMRAGSVRKRGVYVYRGRTAGRRRAGDDDPNAGLPAQDAVATVGGPSGRQAVDEAAFPAAEAAQRTALIGAGQGRVREHRRRGFGRRGRRRRHSSRANDR
jgi:hypothetical protein